MEKNFNLTFESLKIISDELDQEFGITAIEFNELSAQNMTFSDSLSEYVENIKKHIDRAIENIKFEGKHIIEDITINIVSYYNHLLDQLKEKSHEFIKKVELLIYKWIQKLYEFIIRSIPISIKSETTEFELQDITLERTYGIKAGFKTQITDLFELVAEANINIKTTYTIKV